jgi:hypothetical protein
MVLGFVLKNSGWFGIRITLLRTGKTKDAQSHEESQKDKKPTNCKVNRQSM